MFFSKTRSISSSMGSLILPGLCKAAIDLAWRSSRQPGETLVKIIDGQKLHNVLSVETQLVDHLVLCQLLPCTCPGDNVPLSRKEIAYLSRRSLSSFEDVLHGKELGVGETGGNGRGSVIPSSVQSFSAPSNGCHTCPRTIHM